jgi:hypothetical protein
MTTDNLEKHRTSRSSCVHHWIVEPAGGPTSGARCRRCGDERLFFNDPDAVIARDDRPRPGFQPNTAEEPLKRSA